jgi:muconolactone delta-isomerase
MEFLVEFEVNVPDAAPASEIDDWMHVTITSFRAHPNAPPPHTAISATAGARS